MNLSHACANLVCNDEITWMKICENQTHNSVAVVFWECRMHLESLMTHVAISATKIDKNIWWKLINLQFCHSGIQFRLI